MIRAIPTKAIPSVLGLSLAYMKANDPLIKSILPPTTMPAATSKELSALQGSKLTNLENTVASLAKASKILITPSSFASKPAQLSATHSKSSCLHMARGCKVKPCRHLRHHK